jgi:hypothetical protein
MARNMRQSPYIRVVPLPAVPITPAQACCFHLDDYAVTRDDRVRNIRDPRRGAKRVIKKRAHQKSMVIDGLLLRGQTHSDRNAPSFVEIVTEHQSQASAMASGQNKKRLQPWDNCKRLTIWRPPSSPRQPPDTFQWSLPLGISLPHPVYCKEGATDSTSGASRKNPIKSEFPLDFKTSGRDPDRTFRAILTRSIGNIFRARVRREDFSHSDTKKRWRKRKEPRISRM